MRAEHYLYVTQRLGRADGSMMESFESNPSRVSIGGLKLGLRYVDWTDFG